MQCDKDYRNDAPPSKLDTKSGGGDVVVCRYYIYPPKYLRTRVPPVPELRLQHYSPQSPQGVEGSSETRMEPSGEYFGERTPRVSSNWFPLCTNVSCLLAEDCVRSKNTSTKVVQREACFPGPLQVFLYRVHAHTRDKCSSESLLNTFCCFLLTGRDSVAHRSPKQLGPRSHANLAASPHRMPTTYVYVVGAVQGENRKWCRLVLLISSYYGNRVRTIIYRTTKQFSNTRTWKQE